MHTNVDPPPKFLQAAVKQEGFVVLPWKLASIANSVSLSAKILQEFPTRTKPD